MERAGFVRRWRWLGGLALTALLLSDPGGAALGAARSMAHWAASVAPALFPFLALMPLLTCPEAASAYERLLGRAAALFGLPGAAASALVVGLAAGSPAGTLAARRVAARSGMNRGQLHRIAVAAAGFSPAFLVGGVGAAMLGDPGKGWQLLAAQALAQLTLLALLRRAWRGRTELVADAPGSGEAQPVRSAVLAVLTIGGYMALFGAIAQVAGRYIGRGAGDALLCLLDAPSGARLVADLPLEEGVKLALLAGVCGFGGLCVAAQNLGALRGCGMPAWEYVALRVLAGVLCAGYAALLARLPEVNAAGLAARLRADPFAAAGIIASLLAIPVLRRMAQNPIS